jgi:CheY-like chemotaxis protein
MAKILVADDDPDFVEFARIVLEREGHTIVSAAGGGEAMDKIAEDTPDLIVLDVIMDTFLDGLSVSQELSEHADYEQIPIIMITSIANTDYAELLPTDEHVHLDAFLTKPVAPEQLAQEVNRLLRE